MRSSPFSITCDGSFQVTNEKRAKAIARGIFARGDAMHDTVQRIQFKGGVYPDTETNLGGLNESALAQVIEKLLEQTE